MAEPRAEVLDFVVDGANLTARLPRAGVPAMLRDFAHELTDLIVGRRQRVLVQCPSGEEPWALGAERLGSRILLSLVRNGPEIEVAYVERSLDGRRVVAALLDALALARRLARTGAMADELAIAHRALASACWIDAEPPSEPVLVAIDPDPTGTVHVSAEIELRRPRSAAQDVSSVDRADLFALLQRGAIRVQVGGRTRVFPQMFVFLFAERLAALATELLEAWEQSRLMFRRIEIFGIVIGVRFGANAAASSDPAQGSVWLTMGERRSPSSGAFGHGASHGPGTVAEPWTFRLSEPRELVEAVMAFGRALARTLVRYDPDQRRNLRLTAFRQTLRNLAERWNEASEDASKVNEAPDRYRAFPGTAASESAKAAAPPSKLRYVPGFTALVPGIDLRSTFLCGQHLVVGGARETAVVDRQTGVFLWRKPTLPAVAVVTPLGLARLFADGGIALHDFDSGEIKLTTRVSPRVGGALTGAVIHATGLPKLLVVTEGERYVSAIDLRTGERQWRHAVRVGKAFRMRRAGKLLIVAAGDASLTALDIASGEVVWRICDRRRFGLQVGLDRESLLAIAGEPDSHNRSARIYHLDPYAGAVRWQRDLPPGPAPLGPPLVTEREVILITRDRRGMGMQAFEKASGRPLWDAEPGVAPHNSAWLTIDDRLVFNCESGVVMAIHTGTGNPLWRHSLARGVAGDQPRRLEPVLRSGALFVPQQQVHVVSPRDGAVIGCVQTDIIPDLLRVDERCDVYVAEESGHLASFRAGPKLRLV